LASRFCDESEFGFGWIAEERLARTSHALAADGRVWLVDAFTWPEAEERVRSLGKPAGVIQLLDRHGRDCAAIAARLGIPHLRVPDSLDAPFEVVRVVDLPVWRERALWWPERRVLVAADALGTIGYFALAGEPLGLHPFLRPFPPRSLRRYDPDVVLVGHGEGIRDASEAYRSALASARRRVLHAVFRRGPVSGKAG
jgi:hypothetical protein